MQINFKKIKEISFILAFVAIFGISHQAQASDTYSSPGNNGLIWATVNIVPSATMSANATFDVTGQLSSASSTSEVVNLTVSNNGGAELPLVPLTAGTITLGSAASSALNQKTFTAPGVAGTYNVLFTTYVDITPPVVQNYWYETNLGAILGVCSIMPDPNSGQQGYMIAHRDAATEQSAAARGVTRASVDFQITTDNQKGYVTSLIHADFYPGDLDLVLPGYEGGINHDSGGYCSGLVQDAIYNQIFVQEFF